MGKKKKSHIKTQKRWIAISASIVFVLACVVFGYIFLNIRYSNRAIPGIKLSSVSISGMRATDIEKLLNDYQYQIETDGFIFRHQNKSVVLYPTIVSTLDADLSYNLITIDSEATVNKVMEHGHQGSFWQKTNDFIQAYTQGINVSPHYSLDQDEIIKILTNNFSEFDTPANNPVIQVSSDNKIIVSQENSGQILDYELAVEELTTIINDLEARLIILKKVEDTPTITLAETQTSQIKTKDIISRLPWILEYEDYRWLIDNQIATDWFEFSRDKSGEIIIDLNDRAVIKYLKAIPGTDLDIAPKEGKFVLEDERVTEFQVATNGSVININDTLNQMRIDLINNPGAISEIKVDTIEPTSSTEDINQLGIKELVGEGSSNFRGSPRNRVHNIQVGANTLNGLLIKPGEEFSLVSALGDIDATTGYLPELVIKGNRTIPEYGGGLCQIGTTFFRAVLDSGLSVTARQNHSYRVSYYEPPVGMDATIYNPQPDFKFINDYDKHLLLQTRIEGTQLIFKLYGTKDGREASTTEPRVYNYVKPGPTKYIDTEDLAPGETECTEKAHTGADAEFTYTVIFPDGRVEEEIFKSHYKAWPEICLVGQEPEDETQEEETETNDGETDIDDGDE
ncbi:VanW family protein [Patescibacteria group bacterium]|nr:VanW family protein [Patescibacteria group bacterium]MBU1891118.1 VanW family protein [Patescibacteria group bacterium]